MLGSVVNNCGLSNSNGVQLRNRALKKTPKTWWFPHDVFYLNIPILLHKKRTGHCDLRALTL